jgi:hypothetical protein
MVVFYSYSPDQYTHTHTYTFHWSSIHPSTEWMTARLLTCRMFSRWIHSHSKSIIHSDKVQLSLFLISIMPCFHMVEWRCSSIHYCCHNGTLHILAALATNNPLNRMLGWSHRLVTCKKSPNVLPIPGTFCSYLLSPQPSQYIDLAVPAA